MSYRRVSPNRYDLKMALAGYKGDTCDAHAKGGGTAVTAQQLYGCAVGLIAGDDVAALAYNVVTAPTTPANLTDAYICLIDKNGRLLARTNNIATATQSVGDHSSSITTVWDNVSAMVAGSSYRITSSDGYYLCALMDQSAAGGMPSMSRESTTAGWNTPRGSGQSRGVLQSGVSVATLTASGGFVATLSGTLGTSFWFGWA